MASYSTATATVVSGTHKFTFQDYSVRKDSGRCYSSSKFQVGQHNWSVLLVLPFELEEFLTCYVRHELGDPVVAKITIALLDQIGNNHQVMSWPMRELNLNACGGPINLLGKSQLEGSEFLLYDQLVIHALVEVVIEESTTRDNIDDPVAAISRPIRIPAPLEEELLSLLKQVGGEVEFDVQGERIKAHKLVLAARSPVFKAQFYGQLQPSQGTTIRVTDIEPPVFKAMLDFIYTDSSGNMDIPMAQHLYAAANKYELDKLQDDCEAFLATENTLETVLSTLALAEQYEAPYLKTACLAFLTENAQEFFCSNKFTDLLKKANAIPK